MLAAVRRPFCDSSWRARWLSAGLGAALAASAALGCALDDEGTPDLAQLHFPTGLAVTPDASALLVTNGAWDYAHDSSTLVVVDLGRLETEIDAPGPVGAALGRAQSCRRVAESPVVECDPETLVSDQQTVRLGRGAGNIAVDTPSGPAGAWRLLVPTRIDAGLTWVDARRGDDGTLELDCGQAADSRCDDAHTVGGIDSQPAMVTVDRQGFRYAYLPHLLGGRLTLIGLDGDFGPERRDVDAEFFDRDPLYETDMTGGFAVAQRACDVASGNAPSPTDNCTRPYLYASQRFWWGLRAFRAMPGRDRISAGGRIRVLGTSVESAQPRPLMGDIEFADPDTGERLLVVHTTPPALALVDTSLRDDNNTNNELVTSVPVCSNPNMLEVYRPPALPAMAFVSCYGGAEVVAVDLPTFTVIAHIDVGEGANEMAVDPSRSWLFVANTAENSVSIVDLRPTSSRYLRELAVLGIERNWPRLAR